MSWFHALLLIPTVPLVWEDFRRRKVGVVWLGLLGGGAVAIAWADAGALRMLTGLAVNTVVLTVLLGGMWLWLRLRGRRIGEAFGAGDAAFMLAVAPLFTPTGYVWFLLASCTAALAAYFIAHWKTVPLAGVMGCVLAAYTLYIIEWN